MGALVERSPMVVTHGEPGPKNCSVKLTITTDNDAAVFGVIYGPSIAVASIRADLVVDGINSSLKRIGLS